MQFSGRTRKVYGVDMPIEMSDLDIELRALAFRHPKEKGGLGHYGHLIKVLKMLWPHKYEGLIDHEYPRMSAYAELMAWAWCNYEVISAFGHASAGKSHDFAHIVAAEYLAAFDRTAAIITSTHMQGLRNRIFNYIFEAVRDIRKHYPLEEKRNPIPVIYAPGGSTDKLVIQGIATNRGDEATTKIQGIHAPRVIVVIDEAAGTPQAIFDAAANLQVGTEFFRQVMLMNPDDMSSHAATWAEPPEGFRSVEGQGQSWWETRRPGGVSIHFSWDRCPNKIAGRTVYPYLLDAKSVDNIRSRYGDDSPQFYTFALGWFPPTGLQGYVFNQAVLEKAVKRHSYDYAPVKIAALDPAFEGGDLSAIAVGEYDPATHKMNLVDVFEVKVSVSGGEPLDYLTARATMQICAEHGVKPRDFIMDVTGGGRGVHNFLVREWSPEVVACNFGGAATERRFKPHDPDTAKAQVDRFVSELWWGARSFCEEGMVGGIDPVAQRDLREELMSRRYVMKNDRLISVEKKSDMKNRLGRSPDRADAFCLLVELLRRRGAVAHPDGAGRVDVARPLLDVARQQQRFLVESWGNPEPERRHVLPFGR